MQNKLQTFHKIVSALLLIMALFSSGLNLMVAQAATLSSTTCVGTGTVTCNLWAKSATISLPGAASVKILGYTDSAAGTLSAPGGPTLIVNQGDTVTVNLTNNLTEASGLLFQGQAMIPDRTGAVATAGTKSYTFTAIHAGTYLYEAALLPNAQHQVAMGLYGALIVRPATANQAYETGTDYNDEALVLLSEIDTVLNNSANPSAFDMRNYHPRYWMINGKVYPNTDTINTVIGNKVLLRYVNAGLQPHSMSLLGLNQSVIAVDGSALVNSRTYVAETLAPGQTLDAITTIPTATTNGSRFALYEAGFLQHNNNTAGFGGMLAFIQAGTGSIIVTDTSGPATGIVSLTNNPNNGTLSVALSASISDAASGNANVTAAEYFIDTAGANGTGTALSGSFGSPTVSINATLSTALLGSLSSGNHTIYVHGKDSLNNWGSFNVATLTLDKTGPTTSGLTLTPNPSNGTVSVALHGTGNDSASGGSNIVAAEYFIGTVPVNPNGLGTAMTVNVAAPVASLDKTITPPVTGGFVSVHSRDALGNWGPFATITLNVVAGGPVTSAVSASKNPNNGTLPLNASQPVVRVTATITSTGATVSAAEAFIDTVGTTGSGFPFIPSDGIWNGAGETAYSDIPLANINLLSTGAHTFYVHGKDAAGNWGTTTPMTFVIDRTPPTVSGATLTPIASNNTAVMISATGTDTTCVPSICIIGGGEYYIDAAGAAGTGTVMTSVTATMFSATIPAATIGALTTGNHLVYVRSRDAAGNWSTSTANATLLIDRTAPTFTGISLTPNSIPVGTSSVGLTVNGAADPLVSGLASSVGGGEYWFGSTNITTGTGTAFNGLTTTIPTTSLAACTYTVRTRIRDNASNWSTGTNGVRTATLTVTGTPADAIFSDGFETGTLNPLTGWSSSSTTTTSRLNASAASAMVGSFGLQAQGNNTNYVQYDFGTCPPVAPKFDARFYFNPNGFIPNGGATTQDVFVARTSGGTTVFRVRYRMNGAQPQVQIQVGTGTGNAAWTNVTNGSANSIEVVWQAAGSGLPNPGTLALYVNSAVAQQTLTTTSTNSVGSVRLGSVTDAGNNGNTTLEYFDAFSAKRSVSPLIGP